MIRVILVEPEGSYNVGFVARLCKNFSVDELYLVSPKIDIKEALRFSAKGKEVLEKAVIVSNYDDAIRDLDIKIATSSIADIQGDLLRNSIRPWEILNFIDNKRIGLIFGRESVGLTRDEISKADFLLFIPANPEYPVLNLSHAVSIILYEIWKNKDKKKEIINKDFYNLIDKYAKNIISELFKGSKETEVYIALKRVLFKGLSSNDEAKFIVRFLRKAYVRLKSMQRTLLNSEE
jgi:TrmH family RNA methyltransferase